MAKFERKELRRIFESAEIEVPKDVLTQICELHTASNEEILEALNETKESLTKAERERDDYKTKMPKDGEETVSKAEYDKINEKLEQYKTKETHNAKLAAYRNILEAAGISKKRIDTVLKATNVDEVELDKDGKIKDAEQRIASAKTEWSDFIETTNVRGTETATPPSGTPVKKTKEEIIAIKDPAERRAEIAKNIDLFD